MDHLVWDIGRFRFRLLPDVSAWKCLLNKMLNAWKPLSGWFIHQRHIKNIKFRKDAFLEKPVFKCESCLEIVSCRSEILSSSSSSELQSLAPAGNQSRRTKWVLFCLQTVLLEMFSCVLHSGSRWFHSWLNRHWSFAPHPTDTQAFIPVS